MKLGYTLAAALIVGAPALAQSAMDTDGDGNVSMEELQVVYPDVTETTFAAIDTDADGVLSEAEVTAAVEAGILPS